MKTLVEVQEKPGVLHTIHKWDRRYLEMAELVSSWSKDPSTKCGAVIVRHDKTIASVGYNGFPRGCDDSPELYANRELKYERVVHAECNAILNGYEQMDGYSIYTWPAGYGPTCSNCAKHIIQAGIKEVFHLKDESEFAMRWKEQAEIGLQMYAEANVAVWSYPLEYWNDSSRDIQA
jgi:dCMP deaminase